MKLGRRCIQVQCDLSDAISVGELIPRLLLSLDPPVHLAPTDLSTYTTNGTNGTNGTNDTNDTNGTNGTNDTNGTNGIAKAVPHTIIEQPQQALRVPVIPNNDIHILVNNAAILAVHSSEAHPMSSFNHVLQTNLSTPFQLCRDMGAYWLRELLPAGVDISSRSIINVSSIYAYHGGMTVPAYTSSKGGLAQLTKALSNEWAMNGIRVNTIAPGACATEMNFLSHDPREVERAKQYVARIPARRWGTIEDFKGIVVFLASEKASGYITGETVVIDGGWMAT